MSNISIIDVSEFQVNVDFNKVKSSGIKAVILRAGYGRESSQKDKMFERHYEQAKKAGLKLGCYWYSYADSVEDAKEEANACCECIKNKSFDLPVYYDMEDNSQYRYGKNELTKFANAFCSKLTESGYRAGVYANLNWFTNFLNYKELKSKWSIWLAQYNDKPQLECDIWQKSSTGRVLGYDGNIDVNVVYNNDIYSEKSEEKPTLTYRSYYDGSWHEEICGLSDISGAYKQAISAIAIKVSEGNIRYRVHMRGSVWLPWVNKYDISDDSNGYAGIKGRVIDCVQIEYNSNNNDYKATYKVRPQGSGGFYNFQFNTEKGDTKEGYIQDGYAGIYGHAIDGIQITLT